MQTYRFNVVLELEVDAFEFGDALEVVEDYFEDSIGELKIIQSTIKHK